MSFFVIKSCQLNGCLHWRVGDKCAKHDMWIPNHIKFTANMHDSSVCEARKQINKYRLEQMLEK